VTGDARTLGSRFLRGAEVGDRYGVVLVAISVSYILLSTLERARWTRLLLVAVLGITLLLVLFASRVPRAFMRIAIAACLFSVVVVLIEALTDSNLFSGSTYLVFGLLILISPFVILNRIFRHPEVSMATLMGAICVYALLGIVFAEMYLMLNDLDTFFAQGPKPPGDFLYFSFVTMTTLGYGDLSPGSRAAKMVVSIEAIVGQLFIAILVARLVTSYVGRRRSAPSLPDSPDATD
jgi:voltage-gated potassium channel Kch